MYNNIVAKVEALLCSDFVFNLDSYRSDIPVELGVPYGQHLVDNYEEYRQSIIHSGKFDHWFNFTNEDYTMAFVYSQPYGSAINLDEPKVIGKWKLIFESSDSIYNQRPMSEGASTRTELWALDISGFHLYRNKGVKGNIPTTIVNVKLDESDRKFKQLIYIDRN